MTDIEKQSEVESLVGVAEPVRSKLLELKDQLDKVESIVGDVDSASIKDLQETVNKFRNSNLV